MKATAESKNSLVNLHNFGSILDPGASARATIQTLGQYLKTGKYDAEDVAEVITALFSEEDARSVEAMKATRMMDFLPDLFNQQ